MYPARLLVGWGPPPHDDHLHAPPVGHAYVRLAGAGVAVGALLDFRGRRLGGPRYASGRKRQALLSGRCDVEKVVGIGRVFFRAEDPGALREWYADNLGVVAPRAACGARRGGRRSSRLLQGH